MYYYHKNVGLAVFWIDFRTFWFFRYRHCFGTLSFSNLLPRVISCIPKSSNKRKVVLLSTKCHKKCWKIELIENFALLGIFGLMCKNILNYVKGLL